MAAASNGDSKNENIINSTETPQIRDDLVNWIYFS